MKQLLLTSIAIMALALAGCAENADTAPEGVQDTATQDPGDGNQTQQGDGDVAASNTPPTAELVADTLNGTAPLIVNFTVDGSDADGDNLTWDLSLNGTSLANGTDLPAQANATFEAAGNFTVSLTVSDGLNETTANLTIAVSEGVPSGPCGAEAEPCVLDENTWVEFWSDGSCRMKDEYVQADAGGIYINDRHGASDPAGTGLLTGGGTWVYEESNGEPGMWVHADEGGDYGGCVNGDTIIF